MRGVYPHTHVVPKTYPAELVARISRLYSEGFTQAEIASLIGSTQKIVWRVMRNHGIAARVAAKRDQRGPLNDAWAGDDAENEALHTRVEIARGKPAECQRCGTTDPAQRYEWANLTGCYADLNDYERMCVACHRRFDADRRRATGATTGMPRVRRGDR